MNVYKRIAELERRYAADLDARMIEIAAAELDVDPEELRDDIKQLAAEARAFPSPEAHIASVAESLGMTVDALAQEARRLETAALTGGR